MTFSLTKLLTTAIVAYYGIAVVNAEQFRKGTSASLVKTIHVPEGKRKTYTPSIA